MVEECTALMVKILGSRTQQGLMWVERYDLSCSFDAVSSDRWLTQIVPTVKVKCACQSSRTHTHTHPLSPTQTRNVLNPILSPASNAVRWNRG